VRELVCRSGELPNHFVQVLNAGEGVPSRRGQVPAGADMQTPLMLTGWGVDAGAEAHDGHLRSFQLEMGFFELLPDDPRLIPREVFLPFDGT
jgi:hypothetical protein